MAPIWTASTSKHGVPRHEAIFAIVHASFIATPVDTKSPARSGGVVRLYIGPANDLTSREIEVLVEEFSDGREAVIFHVQPVSDKWNTFRKGATDVPQAD